MKNIELFKDTFYQLPKHYEGNFQLCVQENLKEYIVRLSNYDSWLKEEIDTNRSLIERLCNSINESIKLYLKGLPSKAYSTIRKSLDELKPYLLYPDGNKVFLVGGNINNYFRMRESCSKVDKVGIFHIPFKSRHLTQSYRYSIPGIPCLYLSNSVFLCWEEIGKPVNKRLYCSRFEIDSNRLRVLNLSYTPSKVLNMYNPNQHELTSKVSSFFIIRSLITWPLLFACSIHTKCHKDNFKAEYIIPQLVMQWCLENDDIDGVCYYSVRSRYNSSLEFSLFQENLALPAKINQDDLICSELKKKIKVSEPQLISSYNYLKKEKLSPKKNEIWILNNPPSFFNYVGRKSFTQEDQPSIFDKFEIELLLKEVDYIQ
jgi:hypothetical protein